MSRRLERIDRPIKVLTEDIYALSSLRNMLYVAAPRILPALLLLSAPLLSPGPFLWHRRLSRRPHQSAIWIAAPFNTNARDGFGRHDLRYSVGSLPAA
jgi:hypothetical protein